MIKMQFHAGNRPPCRHMRSLLDRAADGQEDGLFVRYARLHAKGCRGCGTYLHSLQEMVGRLHCARVEDDTEALERLMSRLDA